LGIANPDQKEKRVGRWLGAVAALVEIRVA
jgi:hypothetical protein